MDAGTQLGLCADPEPRLPWQVNFLIFLNVTRMLAQKIRSPDISKNYKQQYMWVHSSSKGQLPSPWYSGGPGAPRRKDNPRGPRAAVTTRTQPHSCHPSPQEADQVHAAPDPPLRGALRGVRALPRTHRRGCPAVL